MRLPADLRATLPVDVRHPNHKYAVIAETVPGGYAGTIFENDHYVLLFVDAKKAIPSRDDIIKTMLAHDALSPYADIPSTEIRGGARWTFFELYEWNLYITIRHVWPAGFVLQGIDVKENAVRIAVTDEASRAELEAQLASLGISCNLVRTIIMIRPRLL